MDEGAADGVNTSPALCDDARPPPMSTRTRAMFSAAIDHVDALACDVARRTTAELQALAAELRALAYANDQDRARLVIETRHSLADLDELHAANRLVTVGRLTVGMAPELGTPLGVALARAQMIVTDDDDLAGARADAREIIVQVQRMTQMCREVLDYARPKPLTELEIDVIPLVRQLIALLVPDARKRRARLVLSPGPLVAMVRGDASKLLQILTNLVINAAQSMPAGGTITLGVSISWIEPPPLEGLPAGDYVCVRVSDTGTGIRPAHLPRIFDTFFTTKPLGEGTGLGLAVSSRIAREHHGWIGVETALGVGTTFTLHLPALSGTALA
jgi:two-component system, NtrC family, sensor kinase